MKKRSILDELSSIGRSRDINAMMSSRTEHIVASVRNLREFIRDNFTTEQADELERTLINSIKSGDSRKFQRNLERIQNQM
jgi:hypothetical protein